MGDRVFIPVELWKHITRVISKWYSIEASPWLLSNLPDLKLVSLVQLDG